MDNVDVLVVGWQLCSISYKLICIMLPWVIPIPISTTSYFKVVISWGMHVIGVVKIEEWLIYVTMCSFWRKTWTRKFRAQKLGRMFKHPKGAFKCPTRHSNILPSIQTSLLGVQMLDPLLWNFLNRSSIFKGIFIKLKLL